MRAAAKGEVLIRANLVAHRVKLEELARALGGTPTAPTTAAIGLFFGPTIAGEKAFVDAIKLDLTRALLGGHEVSWSRPFRADERIVATLEMVSHSEKSGMEIGVFETKFATPSGESIQVQRTTFIERAPKR